MHIPLDVVRTAQYGLELSKNGFGGGTEAGVARAKQLSAGGKIYIEDIRSIRNFLARHHSISRPAYIAWKENGYKRSDEWKKRHGIVAWMIWGGDEALKWVNSAEVRGLLEREYGKKYEVIGLNHYMG